MYKHTKKAAQIEQLSLYEWCHQESNRGHKDFQSFALPTELWHQVVFCIVVFDYGCKGRDYF